MPIYNAPIDDMKFVQRELGLSPRIAELEELGEFSDDVIDAVLEEASKLCESVLLPINRSGDEQGCAYENGVVRTPDGFKEAYREFADGGWTSMAAHPQYGGQGLPHYVNVAIEEMMCSANLAFSMYPGLSMGAYRAIHHWGSEEQKSLYLPRIADGSWSGTMCLTEPHCGTDLGLLRTRAAPREDGAYEITGTKIFISAGEHDLTENIIHLVLARTPDAPPGTAGISLFIVPKFLPKATDETVVSGERNGVRCAAIEHKMGINGSATCVLNFDSAIGYLIGEPNKGMRAMFTMMNAARLGVGVQGLGICEIAYQNAVSYARDRGQGKSLDPKRQSEHDSDPILVHADVRKMLLRMRVYSEGSRALASWVSAELDVAERHRDPQVRQEADDFVSLLTPVVKALMTDFGSDCANLGVQVFGGHGYIREHGMEQYVRDARICQIYEGTNGIQALDLIGRKLPAHTGRYLRRFFHPVSNYIETQMECPEAGEFVQPLAKAFARLQRATGHIAQVGLTRPNDASAAASEYLRLFGLVALGYLWARMAQKAQAADGSLAPDFYRAKVQSARFYFQRVLPESSSLFANIVAGGDAIMQFDDDAF